jgi:putative Holliday junction resolvase
VSPDSSAPRRILAVDYGDSRTGLAATDWTGSIVVPLERIDERDVSRLCAALLEVTRDRQTELVVVGMPLNADGSAGPRADRTQQFVEKLKQAVGPIPVCTIDESHTTDEAHERLKQMGMKAARRKNFADSVAAVVILERYRHENRR